jgi:hypothetical protein
LTPTEIFSAEMGNMEAFSARCLTIGGKDRKRALRASKWRLVRIGRLRTRGASGKRYAAELQFDNSCSDHFGPLASWKCTIVFYCALACPPPFLLRGSDRWRLLRFRLEPFPARDFRRLISFEAQRIRKGADADRLVPGRRKVLAEKPSAPDREDTGTRRPEKLTAGIMASSS